MSNARVRKYLEGMSAPVVAWLIDHGYVADDCGILNVRNYHWKEGVRLAMNAASTTMLRKRERL